MGGVTIVVGIPFYNETDTIAHVLETACQGLKNFYPDQKSLIVAVGGPAGGNALQTINSLPLTNNIPRLAFLLDDPQLSGKGWGVRAISEIANVLSADLVVLEADLKSVNRHGEIEGLAPDWIPLLLQPVTNHNADIVFSRFNRHPLESPISTFLVYPTIRALYRVPIHRTIGAQWGISHSLNRYYVKNFHRIWAEPISGYGIDVTIATGAIVNKARICEANMGIKIHRPSAIKREVVLRQIAHALFTRIGADTDWWGRQNIMQAYPMIQQISQFGFTKGHQSQGTEFDPSHAIAKYQQGFDKFHSLYKVIFSQNTYSRLEALTRSNETDFPFDSELWARIIYRMILAYSFPSGITKRDIVDSLIPLFDGFMGQFASNLDSIRHDLAQIPAHRQQHILSLESESQQANIAHEFDRAKAGFVSNWERSAEASEPHIPQITYREFIPGAPLVVPTTLASPKGEFIRANDIYNKIFKRQKADFDHFVYDRLQVPRNATSLDMSKAIKSHIKSVEDEVLPAVDLSTLEGIQSMMDLVIHYFPKRKGFSLVPQMAAQFLSHYPPLNLITKLGATTLDELLTKWDPLDILALTNWAEERDYLQSLWHIIADGLRSEHFSLQPIRPLVVRHQDFPTLVEMRSSSAVDKLTSRIVVSNLHKGLGGEFPKLLYLMTLGKNIIESEKFSQVWERFASERKDFGRKVIDSLTGHWGRDPLSAHCIFEDSQLRVLKDRMNEIARQVAQEESEGDLPRVNRYRLLAELADCYHVALILPDGEFVTCSTWSWATYSFRGGQKSPPPLSAHVERDWFSHEFLLEYYQAVGGTEEAIEETVIELMAQGREWENLAPILLGKESGIDRILPNETVKRTPEYPSSGGLKRFEGNPVLKPVPEHPWESSYVLNAGTIRLNGRVYLAYRAFGEDRISRIGLAVSDDGFVFNERLDEPIFQPVHSSEKMGCEDPRLTLIGDRIYMAYTAYDGLVAQIALASIKLIDFMNYRWKGWQRHGLVFPGYDDKDAALFPERINGKFAMLHRVDPHMWITFSRHMRCPWPRREHRILSGTTTGLLWDGRKIGAGAQPLKTKYGWLLITHGVDYAHVYRLGVMLLDLADPSKLVFRSPNFILEPSEKWELGVDDESWVPNVVFTCGAVPKRDEHIFFLDENDELLVYYGASDTVISLATARVGDLIPEEFRARG